MTSTSFIVEINGYLATLGMTDFDLVCNCGSEPAAEKLYGGKKKQGAWINAIEESGGNDAVVAAVEEEQNEIEGYGNDPTRQVKYIQNLLDGHVAAYQKAKENGGQSFPDFIGALVLDDLAVCAELSMTYRAKQQEEDDARRARIEAEDEERNRLAKQTVEAAIQILQNGGVLKNSTITFYWNRNNFQVYCRLGRWDYSHFPA